MREKTHMAHTTRMDKPIDDVEANARKERLRWLFEEQPTPPGMFDYRGIPLHRVIFCSRALH
jgi:hypothetical protein